MITTKCKHQNMDGGGHQSSTHFAGVCVKKCLDCGKLRDMCDMTAKYDPKRHKVRKLERGMKFSRHCSAVQIGMGWF